MKNILLVITFMVMTIAVRAQQQMTVTNNKSYPISFVLVMQDGGCGVGTITTSDVYTIPTVIVAQSFDYTNFTPAPGQATPGASYEFIGFKAVSNCSITGNPTIGESCYSGTTGSFDDACYADTYFLNWDNVTSPSHILVDVN